MKIDKLHCIEILDIYDSQHFNMILKLANVGTGFNGTFDIENIHFLKDRDKKIFFFVSKVKFLCKISKT